MSKEKKLHTQAVEKNQPKKQDQSFAFDKQNYSLMIVCIITIILGFGLMYGKEDIFSTTKLTVAPIVVVIGFAISIYAIMKRPKD